MQRHRILIGILLAGLVLRLIFALSASVEYAELGGGDIRWYLANGVALLSGQRTGISMGLPFDVSVLPTAPLYLIFVGVFLRLLSFETALVVIRFIQVGLSVATCYYAYDIVQRLAHDKRAGWLAAAILAFAPAFVLEPSNVVTESSYIFYIIGGIWAFVRAEDDAAMNWRWLLLSSVLLALATLTRAVSLLFPVGLAGLLWLSQFRQNWKQGFLAAVMFLGVYASVASTWTIYNALVYDRFVIGSAQLMPSIWRGAVENDITPQASDESLGEATYSEQTTEVIASAPIAYVKRRTRELLASYLQPHGTIGLGAESLKAMLQTWIQDDFSLTGLWRLVNGDGFFPKLLIYIWHFTGLILGLVGMWLTRTRWQISLALVGFILYTTLLHLVIFALPRYIFPAMICYWMFAAIALIRIWDWLHSP
ncbi:MAG: glycosyltransferase family 39 protein [Anaerolineae bacterium]|nr:glycosyltransferase family 39 protein [Anaerolineae bacterium]MDQ7036867.1 glycosyltransferase family 39 protein [Anaerolineae bacterium]